MLLLTVQRVGFVFVVFVFGVVFFVAFFVGVVRFKGGGVGAFVVRVTAATVGADVVVVAAEVVSLAFFVSVSKAEILAV